MMSDFAIALAQAVSLAERGEPYEDTLKRAQAFFNFLTGKKPPTAE